MSSFYEKYLQLCVAHGEKPTAVAKKIGLSNAAPSGWKKGKAPSDATRQSIAAYFEIPVDALDEDSAQKEKPAPGGSELDLSGVSPEDFELLKRILAAPEAKKNAIRELL